MAARAVIAGGSGFIGRQLVRHLSESSWEVVVLTRDSRQMVPGARVAAWDGRTLSGWESELEAATLLVNLAGRSVDCRWSAKNRREIVASRLQTVRLLKQAVAACRHPPPCWVQASAIGYYGNRPDPCDEIAAVGEGFLAEVARQWEEALFDDAEVVPDRVRRVALRLGVVLGAGGGALPRLLTLTRGLAGGTVGSGRQVVSWVHVEDVCRAVEFVVAHPELTGPVNVASPDAVSNRRFMAALRRVMHRPWAPPAPAVAVRFGAWLLGSNGELALGGVPAAPTRLRDAGFSFRYSRLADALADLTG